MSSWATREESISRSKLQSIRPWLSGQVRQGCDVLTGFTNKKVTNLGKNPFKWWDGKNGEMEVANADNSFKKFRSEGVKWLREKETRLEEAFLTCLVCF